MLTDNQILSLFPIKKIVSHFSRSGQRQVVLVETINYGKQVLKIVEENNERIDREIDIIMNNSFVNVPKIYECANFTYSSINGKYIIEEYIEGETLKEILNREKQLRYDDVVDLTDQMLKILVQLERSNIVHRDIKPDNIIKSKNDGKWWLIDFGIARALKLESLTMTGAAVGPHTPGYGAPELFQYSKSTIDSRADIFSLGVVIYEAATGIHPFISGEETSYQQIWYKTVTIDPSKIVFNGDKDGEFTLLIETFMQKHISRRPKNALQAYDWFNSIIKGVIE